MLLDGSFLIKFNYNIFNYNYKKMIRINKGFTTKYSINEYILSNLKFVKPDIDLKYFKYDIDNAFLSPMQNNDKLSRELYLYVSEIRENLWKSEGNFISYEDLVNVLNESIL